MGVYIKGMEMPNNCFLCPLSVLVGERLVCEVTRDEVLRWKIDFNCPIVELPPHGDLIDYNFCLKNYELLHDDDGNPVYAVRMRDINAAPTVIEAEEL